MSQPQAAQSPAQALERCRGLTTPLTRAVTPAAQQPVFELLQGPIEQGQQKAVDQADHEQQFQPGFPFPEAQTFTGQFTLAEAPRHLDLPAPGISEHDLPGIVFTADLFRSEQLPRRPSFPGATDDQPERLLVVRMGNRNRHDSCLEPLSTTSIPHLPLAP
jgi:hypothetical protein